MAKGRSFRSAWFCRQAKCTNSLSVGEVAIELAEAGDLGGADEGKVLGPEEDDLPLALVGGLVEVAEGGAGVGRDHAFHGEIGEFVTYDEHFRGPQVRLRVIIRIILDKSRAVFAALPDLLWRPPAA
jgi:hypothetical protein